MTDLIPRALHWLRLLLAPGTGKRRRFRTRHQPAPVHPTASLPHPRSPYGLHAPLDGDGSALVRPYLVAHDREVEEAALRQRRRLALVLAADFGIDLDQHLVRAGGGRLMEPRLLPWPSVDGKPCYLVTGENGGYLSRLADDLEAAQLATGADVLGLARIVLDDPASPSPRSVTPASASPSACGTPCVWPSPGGCACPRPTSPRGDGRRVEYRPPALHPLPPRQSR